MPLSGLAFLVILTALKKKSFKVKSVFKSWNCLPDSETINKFTALFGVKGALSSCFKQLPSNFNLILDSFHISFGERLLFFVWRGVNFLFDYPFIFTYWDCVCKTIKYCKGFVNWLKY